MVKRFYLDTNPTTFAPSSWLAGWNKTSSITWAAALTRRGNAEFNAGIGGSGSVGHFTSAARQVFGPLRAQTISGTVKGQIRPDETNSTDNYTVAIGIKVVQADGSDRGVLLAVTGSDDASATPPEMTVVTETNRSFLNTAESATLTLTPVVCSEGDFLVVETGYWQNSTSTAPGTLTYGTPSSTTDLPEDNTTVAANNPWVEFSNDIFGGPWYIGTVVSPADNGAANEPVTTSLTPPVGMLDGDLVIIGGQLQVASAGQITQSGLGGQTWASIGETTGNDLAVALWRCRFNGTWSADPSIAFAAQSGTQPTTAFMHVFRPSFDKGAWRVDQAFSGTTFAAPGSPFTVSRAGQTTTMPRSVTLAFMAVAAANTWATLSGANWENTSPNTTIQWRNTAGSDQSITFAHKIQNSAGATGTVTKNQSAGTAGITGIVTIAEGLIIEPGSGNLALSASAPTVSITTSSPSISVPSGNVALSTVAPERVAATLRDVPSGNVALTTSAPDRAVVVNTVISPPSSNLALSTVAPERVVATLRDVPSGNLALSTSVPDRVHAVTISVPSANLALSSVAPDRVGATLRDVPGGNLALSSVAPTIQRADTISPPSANLAISTVAHERVVNAIRDVPSGNLTLSTFAPDVSIAAGGIAISPPSANLALSSVAPERIEGSVREPASGNLVLTASVPDRVHAVTISIPSGNVVLSSVAPAIVQDAVKSVPSANLALSASAPVAQRDDTISVPSGNLSLTASAPDVAANNARSISVATADLSLSTVAPTVVWTDNRSISVPSGNVALSASLVTVARAFTIPIPSANLTLTAVAPDVSTATANDVPSANLTLSTSAPERIVATLREPQSGNIALSASAPTASVNKTISPTSSNLSLSASAPTVVWTDNRSISVPSANLSLTQSAPTVVATENRSIAVPSANLLLSGSAPVFDNTLPFEIQSAQLSLSGSAPELEQTGAVFIAVPSGALTLTGVAPTVTINRRKGTGTRPGGLQSITGRRTNVQAIGTRRTNGQSATRYNLQHPKVLIGR